ncbi:MAG: hypothetical protein ABSC41_03750 [Acidimicrobiales bacterium]
MNTDFNAELYLRLVEERELLDQRQSRGRAPWDQPGTEVAAALVAVDALDADLAQEIVDEYAFAQGLRPGGHQMHGMHHFSQPPGKRVPLAAPRVVATGWTLEPEWGKVRVHYVSLGDRNTSLAITATESAPGTLMHAQGPGGMPITQPQLTDDQGTTQIAHFNGGGGGGGYNGRLVTQRPLSKTTRWIDMGEGRIEIGDAGPPASVRVEPLPQMESAARHIWRRLGTFRHRHFGAGSSIDMTIEAFLAAGVLAPDDPLIEEAHQVSLALSGNPTAGTNIPEPWASLIAGTHRNDGPTGALAIGAVTDQVDGTVISAEGLISTPDSFQVSVATSPGESHAAHPFRSAVKDVAIVWSAEDDRGNCHVGGMNGWGGSPDLSEGTIEFWPPIHAQARELKLMATGATERAVITVSLADWNTE